MKVLFLMLAGVLLLGGCDSTKPKGEIRPVIPLDIGSRWDYEQTVVNADTTFSFPYFTEITGSDTRGSFETTVAVTEYPTAEVTVHFVASNDSVFVVVPDRGGAYVAGLTYFIPDSTVTFLKVEGDVATEWEASLPDTTIVTPAGTFTGVYRFRRLGPNDVSLTLYIAPQVGVVMKIRVRRELSGEWRNTRTSLLQSYSLP